MPQQHQLFTCNGLPESCFGEVTIQPFIDTIQPFIDTIQPLVAKDALRGAVLHQNVYTCLEWHKMREKALLALQNIYDLAFHEWAPTSENNVVYGESTLTTTFYHSPYGYEPRAVPSRDRRIVTRRVKIAEVISVDALRELAHSCVTLLVRKPTGSLRAYVTELLTEDKITALWAESHEQLKNTPAVELKNTPAVELEVGHYNFIYSLTDMDIISGKIKVDPYMVSKQWHLGTKDTSGCLFHMLKTIARFGAKKGNSVKREIDSLQATLDRLKQLTDEY